LSSIISALFYVPAQKRIELLIVFRNTIRLLQLGIFAAASLHVLLEVYVNLVLWRESLPLVFRGGLMAAYDID